MSFSKIILKTQKIFKSESHNVFTEEIMKIASNSSDDKKNVVNWFKRNICIWNEQRANM